MSCDNNFLKEIDRLIQSKHLLNHSFYQAWSRGELSLECLKEYAKQYYHHVKAFPTYLSAIHARTEDLDARLILLKNLIEEEAGVPNHPELWRRFILSLGVTQSELPTSQPSVDMTSLIATFRSICSQLPLAEGVAALYAYESQIPAICISKIEGLKAHYGMRDPKDWEYFSVHIAADEEHATQERRLLQSFLQASNWSSVQAAVTRVLDGLWAFLSGICHQYAIAC